MSNRDGGYCGICRDCGKPLSHNTEFGLKFAFNQSVQLLIEIGPDY